MSYKNDDDAAQGIRNRLKQIYDLIHDIENKRMQSENRINLLINAQQSEKGKVTSLYKKSIQDCQQEETLLREALQKINEIRTIKHERRIRMRLSGNEPPIRKGTCMKMLLNVAKTLPLFIGKIGEKPPALCGAIPPEPDYHAKVGDMIAALVEITGDGEIWIIAEVVSYKASTRKYEVDDILEEQNQKIRHTLIYDRVIPLPLMRANPETDPCALYLPGTVVMALFPQTTCFYEAIIQKLPVTHVDDYEVCFRDSSYECGYSPALPVAQRYIIPVKK